MSILNIDLNNINLDNNFDKDDPNAIYSYHRFGLAYEICDT